MVDGIVDLVAAQVEMVGIAVEVVELVGPVVQVGLVLASLLELRCRRRPGILPAQNDAGEYRQESPIPPLYVVLEAISPLPFGQPEASI